MADFTYDLATAIGQTRLLIPDKVEASAVFTDSELTYFLSQVGGSPKRAAAQALDVMASNEAYVTKATRMLGLTTNGPAVAASLRDAAARLREQADADELAAEGGFVVIEQSVTDFAADEILRNAALRGQL
jgi:hypothetical protein